MSKLKIGVYWAAACGGCDVSLLEVDDQILDLAAAADIVLWPCAADVKYADLKEYPDGWIDLVLFNGAIRTQENLELAHLLRKKSRILVAYGSCAHTGGVIGLANLSNRDEIFSTVYRNHEPEPTESSQVDGCSLELPQFLNRLQALDAVVSVDYYIPGCPPPREIISTVFEAVISGKLPEKGAVFASEKNLCDECPRERTEQPITKLYRPHEIEADPERCLLDQGLICLGPATRGGCGAACPNANMPCTGCAGPTAGVTDQGAAILNTIASLVSVGEEGEAVLKEEDAILQEIEDVIGTFYRFSLASSALGSVSREQ